MPGDEVVENRSCLWFLRTDTQALDAFYSKTHARHLNKWPESWPFVLKSCSEVSKAAMGGEETHTKSWTSS